MKKIVLCILVGSLVIGQQAFSAKLRVNNNGGITGTYTTLQLANDAASSGDTLYVEGSAVSYGDCTFNKKLIIFGTGYFITQNAETQANPAESRAGAITFNSSSLGSIMSGMTVETYLNIQASNITIKRNRIYYQGININANRSNVLILQNWIDVSYGSLSYDGVRVDNGCSNIFIQNNYVHNSYANSINIIGTSSADIANNILDSKVSAYNSSFSNNIMRTGTFAGSNNSFNRNICNLVQFPATNNLQNVDMLTVFDSTQTNVEKKLKLIAGSPALAYGLGGIDCGIYGGLDPYTEAGLPAIPAIYYFVSPSTGSQSTGLPVHIKAKSHK